MVGRISFLPEYAAYLEGMVERQSDKMESCHKNFQGQSQHTRALGLGKIFLLELAQEKDD
jgi:uncharacterized short protein YbdD (DUF466 family)